MLGKSKSGSIEEQEKNEMVPLESLASLAGFPIELIKKELFNGDFQQDEISMHQLRKLMADYLDSTMLEKTNSH